MPPEKRIRKIHFVEFRSKINTLVIKSVFPIYGAPLLTTILKENGYDARMFLEGTSDMRFETLADCDLVCIALSVPALNKAKAFALRVKREKPGIPVIVGGPFVGLFPEVAIDFADYVARCEGDELLPELIARLNNGGDADGIKGLTFLRNGEVVHTPDRKPPKIPTTIPDMTLIDGFEKAAKGLGKVLDVQNLLQTSRGCKFRCRFCPTAKLFGGAFRNRDIESIVEEIKHKQRYNDWFLVVDNSFSGNRKAAKALLEQLISEDLGVSLIAFERQEVGFDEEMLALMKRAGVECLVVGVESLVDDNLHAYNKQQKSGSAIQSIKNIKNHGIHVIGTFVFGYDGDRKEKVPELVDFIRKSKIGMTTFPLHDVGREGEDFLVPVDRRFWTYYERTDPSDTSFFDYFTGHFVTYFPKTMKPSTLQQCLVDIYAGVYTHDYILGSILRKNVFESLFGVFHGYSMRRMTHTIDGVLGRQYMDYLRRIEEGLYDENEVLMEEKLESLVGLPLPPAVPECMDMDSYKGLMLLGVIPGVARYLSGRVVWRVGRAVRSRIEGRLRLPVKGFRSLFPGRSTAVTQR